MFVSSAKRPRELALKTAAWKLSVTFAGEQFDPLLTGYRLMWADERIVIVPYQKPKPLFSYG